MLVLIIWNIWTLWPEVSHEIAIPYTAFVSQVKAGNVKDVQINGAQISGTFQKGLPASDLVPP
ncbi:MAG: ATP-dependent metallopeptidase FtsH/Yme1/Tma family protein, partial [Anaerolineales bacterium]